MEIDITQISIPKHSVVVRSLSETVVISNIHLEIKMKMQRMALRSSNFRYNTMLILVPAIVFCD